MRHKKVRGAKNKAKYALLKKAAGDVQVAIEYAIKMSQIAIVRAAYFKPAFKGEPVAVTGPEEHIINEAAPISIDLFKDFNASKPINKYYQVAKLFDKYDFL